MDLHFDLDPSAPAAATATQLQAGLARVANVEQATAAPPDATRFTGLEILAAVTLAANIAHQTSSLIHDGKDIATDTPTIFGALKTFFGHIVDLVKGTPGVHDAKVDVGFKQVSVGSLSDADIQRVADAIIKRAAQAPATTS